MGGDLAAHRALLRWHERLARLLALDLEHREEGSEPTLYVIDMRPPDERTDAASPDVVEVAEDAEFEELPALEAGEQPPPEADPAVEPLDGSS